MSDAKKKGFAQKNFKDAGTGQSFEGGKPVELPAGIYANYEAAGLVGDKAPKGSDPAPAIAFAKAS